MPQPGDIILFQFPQTDFSPGKTRPVLLLKKLPGVFDDWLICMISTQTHQVVVSFDEIISPHDSDFSHSGLNAPSLIRLGRLLIIHESQIGNTIGSISKQRLRRLKTNLINWLKV